MSDDAWIEELKLNNRKAIKQAMAIAFDGCLKVLQQSPSLASAIVVIEGLKASLCSGDE